MGGHALKTEYKARHVAHDGIREAYVDIQSLENLVYKEGRGNT